MPDDRQQQARTRSHLANERTFLAWLRTSVSVMALGVGIAAFLTSHPLTEALAFVTVVAGIAVVAIGQIRYMRMRRAIERGVAYHPYSRWPSVTTALLVLVGTLAALVVIVVDR